jgi:hypothetical protein
MTAVLERPVTSEAPPAQQPEPDEPVLSVGRVALAGALSTSGAAVVAGGVFAGSLGRVVGVLAAVVSAATVAYAVRRGRSWMQYLAVLGIFVTGYLVAVVLPNPTGVTGTVPELVRRALRNGGLDHPPLPFDPGWRFLLCAVIGLLAAAAVSLACGFRNPKLAVLVPVPLLVAAAVNQPEGSELVSGLAGLGLVLVALSVSFGAELAGGTQVSRAFELRQLLRTVAATAVCLVALAGVSKAGFLFPDTPPSSEAKPEKPQVVPLSKIKDRPLFDVSVKGAPALGPWRVGVLDTYADDAWYLPGFDPNRYLDTAVASPVSTTVTATVTARDIEGLTLPTFVGSARLDADVAVQYDPRTGTFRTKEGSPRQGQRYTLSAVKAPNGDQIAAASLLRQPPEVSAFRSAPAAPVIVDRLLLNIPPNPWERLQVLRGRLYKQVVAAGSGTPTDVTTAKVVAMLNGGKATPYEIVAGEALLARWAGLPSRIGYGYYGGTATSTGTVFRPRDGANWLEIHLPGRGWVAVIGVPRRAQSSLDTSQQNNRPKVLPSNQLTLQVFVPVLNRDPQLLYQVVRYWASRLVPTVLGLVLLWRLVPLLERGIRTRRRRRWALAHGPAGRVAVAYAAWRDAARDFGFDDGTASPLEFLADVEEDVEHTELAWLTTRALWGDLQRDLRVDDAVAAEELSRSLRRRLRRAQSPFAQAGAMTGRASLRAPYDPGLPNTWTPPRVPRPRLLVRRLAAGSLALLLFGCGEGVVETRPASRPFPARLLPTVVHGLTVKAEPSAQRAFTGVGPTSTVSHGELWSLRRGQEVVASLQLAQLKDPLSTEEDEVRRGVREAVGNGHYRWFKVDGKQWVGVQETGEISLYLWFPERSDLFAVAQVSSKVVDPESLVGAHVGSSEVLSCGGWWFCCSSSPGAPGRSRRSTWVARRSRSTWRSGSRRRRWCRRSSPTCSCPCPTASACCRCPRRRCHRRRASRRSRPCRRRPVPSHRAACSPPRPRNPPSSASRRWRATASATPPRSCRTASPAPSAGQRGTRSPRRRRSPAARPRSTCGSPCWAPTRRTPGPPCRPPTTSSGFPRSARSRCSQRPARRGWGTRRASTRPAR